MADTFLANHCSVSNTIKMELLLMCDSKCQFNSLLHRGVSVLLTHPYTNLSQLEDYI